jgi:hypothetical protein
LVNTLRDSAVIAWHSLTDELGWNYLTEAIVPAITHEDPRYFTPGHVGLFHRPDMP